MKTIEIIVDRDGRTTVETKGFTGSECRQASRFIEESLGVITSDRTTVEAFQVENKSNKIDLHG